ncbi:histidinol-phosphatase [Larkinella terrae]|uniref:protein-tyrosine-phosphatase n=1 Tax=Larkinella terrae TaxID=2025311 RepID=A0A7K0EG81_9BACT|nr:histidinol-phosphatase [Larkinella terrae]
MGVDIHSHLIPGIDDGVPDLETALTCLRAFEEMGYKKVITTPHILRDYYPNSSDTIRRGLDELREAIAGTDLKIEVEAAAEYLIDDHFVNLLQAKDLLSFGANNYLLVELSFANAPLNLDEIVFQIQTKGYQPILAHPERYSYLKDQSERFRKLRVQGCLFQLNLLSLVGQYGGRVQQQAKQLLDDSMVDFVGSDLHRPRDAEKLAQFLQTKEFASLSSHTFLNSSLL